MQEMIRNLLVQDRDWERRMRKFQAQRMCRGKETIKTWLGVETARKIRLEQYVGANIIQTYKS